MRSSTAMLGALFLLIAAALFFGVYSLLSPSGPTPAGGGDTSTSQVPGTDDGNTGPNKTRIDRKSGRKDRPPSRGRNYLVAGLVTDSEGKPVPGARVRQLQPVDPAPTPGTADWETIKVLNGLFDIDEEEWDRPRPLELLSSMPASLEDRAEGLQIAETVTDGEGRFLLEYRRAFGVGPFQLKAEMAGIGTATANGVRGENAPPPGIDKKPSKQVEMRLGGNGVASGVVISGSEGHPVPGAYVILDDGQKRYAATTDSGGQYKIENVPPGQYRAQAGAKGHPPLTGFLVQVRDDAPNELRLPRGVDLVVFAEGETEAGDDVPVPDAQIYIVNDDDFTYRVGKTGADGKITFAGLPPGTWLVNGIADKLAPFAEEVIALKPEDTSKEVPLLFELTVVTPVTFVDADGTPIPGVQLYTSTWDEDYDQARSLEVPGVSDDQGKAWIRFEFDGPRAVLYGAAPGKGLVAVAPDDELSGEPLEVRMQPGLIVFGTVRTASGAPVPGAVVEIEVVPSDAEAIDDVIVKVHTNAKGEYRFKYVPHGDVLISAYTEDDWSDEAEFEAAPGKTERKVDLIMSE